LNPSPHSVEWIRALAQPYLRGYRPRAVASAGLRGYWFSARSRSRAKPATEIGFFVGYLTDSAVFAFLPCGAPECAVFAFVEPRNSAAHRRLVAAENALVRRTFTYIRWLTHRPPRFQFSASQLPALIRHRPLREWPVEKHEHLSRNFFIETLAWLVRSGLVRKLAEEAAASRKTPVSKRNQRKKGTVGKKKSRHTA
jgi:hypothetical protein